MTDTALAVLPTTDHAGLAKRKVGALKPTPKVTEAIRLMVEEGLDYAKAGQAVGLNARAMRVALEKPHILSHLKQARDVFRNSVNAANILRLKQIRDAKDNMPAVQAIRMLEQIDEDAPVGGGVARAPGLVIQIVNTVAAPAQTPVQVIDSVEANN